MARLWLTLALALFANQALDLPGAAATLLDGGASHGCAEECPGETPTTDCSSSCPACPCAPHGSPWVAPPESPDLDEPHRVVASPHSPAAPHSQLHARSVFRPPAGG